MDKIENIFICLYIVLILIIVFLFVFAVSGEYYMDKICDYLNSTHFINGYCVDNDGKIIKICDEFWCKIF